MPNIFLYGKSPSFSIRLLFILKNVQKNLCNIKEMKYIFLTSFLMLRQSVNKGSQCMGCIKGLVHELVIADFFPLQK